MKIVHSYNKKNGVTYVYEVLESHYNPEKKRSESKRRLIGKLVYCLIKFNNIFQN